MRINPMPGPIRSVHCEVDPDLAPRQHVDHGEESVHLAGDSQLLDRHPGLYEARGVRLSFVSQDVVLGSDDGGGRQVPDIVSPQRGGIGCSRDAATGA